MVIDLKFTHDMTLALFTIPDRQSVIDWTLMTVSAVVTLVLVAAFLARVAIAIYDKCRWFTREDWVGLAGALAMIGLAVVTICGWQTAYVRFVAPQVRAATQPAEQGPPNNLHVR